MTSDCHACAGGPLELNISRSSHRRLPAASDRPALCCQVSCLWRCPLGMVTACSHACIHAFILLQVCMYVSGVGQVGPRSNCIGTACRPCHDGGELQHVAAALSAKVHGSIVVSPCCFLPGASPGMMLEMPANHSRCLRPLRKEGLPVRPWIWNQHTQIATYLVGQSPKSSLSECCVNLLQNAVHVSRTDVKQHLVPMLYNSSN